MTPSAALNTCLVHVRDRRTCDCPRCALVVARASSKRLPLFTVYAHARDFPDLIVVRLWLSNTATLNVWGFPSLEDARASLEGLGLHRMVRHPEDDVAIVETWV